MAASRFSSAIPSEGDCIEWLLETNPFLAGKKVRRVPNRPYFLRESGTKLTLSVATGTVFQSSKLELRQWYHLILLILSRNRLPNSEALAKKIGCSRKTAISMIRLLCKSTLWQSGSALPKRGGKGPSGILPLPLVRRIANLRPNAITTIITDFPSAEQWLNFLAAKPPRQKDVDLDHPGSPSKGWVAIEPHLGSIAKALRDAVNGHHWLTGLNVVRIAENVVFNERKSGGRVVIQGRTIPKLLNSLGFCSEKSGPEITVRVLWSAQERIAAVKSGPKERWVVVAALREAAPWAAKERQAGIWTFTARCGSKWLYWTSSSAPNDRECKRMVDGLFARFGPLSHFLTNHRRLGRFVPSKVYREFLEPDSIHFFGMTRRQMLSNRCYINSIINRPAASQAESPE